MVAITHDTLDLTVQPPPPPTKRYLVVTTKTEAHTVSKQVVRILLECCLVTGRNEVGDSVHGGVSGQGEPPPPRTRENPPGTRQTPPPTPPVQGDPPGKQTPEYGLRAAGRHPTGMYSCLFICFSVCFLSVFFSVIMSVYLSVRIGRNSKRFFERKCTTLYFLPSTFHRLV